MTKTNSLLSTAATYGLSNAALAFAQFTVIILFSKILPAEDFGRLSIFFAVYTFFSMAVGLGFPGSVQSAFYRLDRPLFGGLLAALLQIIIGFASVVSSIAFIFSTYLEVITGLEILWIETAILAATGQIFVQILQIILQSQAKVREYVLLSIFQVSVQVAVVTCVVNMNTVNWRSAIVAFATWQTISGIASAVYLARVNCRFRVWPSNEVLTSLRYGIPLVPHQLGGWVTTLLDRFLLLQFVSLAQIGSYSLAFQIGQGINLFSAAINQAVVPHLFQLLKGGQENRNQIRRLTVVYVLIIIIAAVIYAALFLLLFPLFYSGAFLTAYNYAPWIIASFAILALSRIASNFFLYFSETYILTMATVVAALISLSLNLLFIPQYGVLGACWANLIGLTSLLLINLIFMYRGRRNV